MKECEMEFVKEIAENSDGSERKIGDFLIRNDFGANAYYIGNGGTVRIPDEIDDSISLQLSDAKNISELLIPGTRKELSSYDIGTGKFGSRDTLTKLTFAEGFKRLHGQACFGDCEKLTEVVLPESLEYLGHNAFKNSPWLTENLEEIDGCIYLGNFLISSNKDIVHANVREGTKMICAWAFKGRKSLLAVIIPESVKTIGEQAFTGCEKLECVAINGRNLQRIEGSAFTGCTGLKQIDIPDSCIGISPISFVSNTGKILYLPEWAYIPNVNLEECNAIQKLFYTACYLTSKERYSAEEQVKYETAVKKMKAKLLDFIITSENVSALRNILPIAITKKNAETVLEKVQAQGAVELTVVLLDYLK